jgi:hypothetical protein
MTSDVKTILMERYDESIGRFMLYAQAMAQCRKGGDTSLLQATIRRERAILMEIERMLGLPADGTLADALMEQTLAGEQVAAITPRLSPIPEGTRLN